MSTTAATSDAKAPIEIESNEGKVFKLEPNVAAHLMLLKKDEDKPVKLEKFNTAILSKVVVFCTYHATKEPMTKIKMPLKSLEMRDNVQKWYADFIDGCDQQTLFQLITAGNDLGVAPLMTLASAKVAAVMRQMPRDQMMQMMQLMGSAMQQKPKV